MVVSLQQLEIAFPRVPEGQGSTVSVQEPSLPHVGAVGFSAPQGLEPGNPPPGSSAYAIVAAIARAMGIAIRMYRDNFFIYLDPPVGNRDL